MKPNWADVVFPASAPVPSSSQPKMQTDRPQLAMGPSGRGFFLLSEVTCLIADRERTWNGSGIPFLWFLSPSFVPYSKVGCMTANKVSRDRFAHICGLENRTPWRDLSPGPVEAVPFHGHSHRGQPVTSMHV